MKRTHLESWLSEAYTHCQYGSKEWCEGYLVNALETIREQAAEIDRLKEALTPSAGTKAEYIGEFTIAVERYVNDDGEADDENIDPYEHISVPWTTIKEIMGAIRTRALLTPAPNAPMLPETTE